MLPSQEQQNGSGGIDSPLTRVDKQMWTTSILRVREGYTYRGRSIPPAVITDTGCHLAQKKPNHHGYIMIEPVAIFPFRARKNEPRDVTDRVYESAHRVVCYLTKSEDDVYNLLYRGYEASHLCHHRTCINPDHLVVETRQANLSRKVCAVTFDVETRVNGRLYILKAEECPHSPRCVIILETRAAVECAHSLVDDPCNS
ncbi:zinc-binding loop region of homing endonuclease-domain-containing protein [Lipomyces starkeyi]